jgi:hypothetical protein
MPTADELISPASIRELARVLNRAHPASQWGSVQAAAGQLGPLGLSDRSRTAVQAVVAGHRACRLLAPHRRWRTAT